VLGNCIPESFTDDVNTNYFQYYLLLFTFHSPPQHIIHSLTYTILPSSHKPLLSVITIVIIIDSNIRGNKQ